MDKDKGGVDVAFLQGGMPSSSLSDGIISLGSLYYEPLWIFHGAGLGINQLSDLRGKRISVGVEGSGTKVLVMHLLTLNDVAEQNTKLLSQGGKKAADMLMQGEIDAAFFATAHHSPVIRQLLHSKNRELHRGPGHKPNIQRYLFRHAGPSGKFYRRPLLADFRPPDKLCKGPL